MICDRCKRKITAETSVYSPYRKVNYCAPAGWVKCDQIFKKKAA